VIYVLVGNLFVYRSPTLITRILSSYASLKDFSFTLHGKRVLDIYGYKSTIILRGSIETKQF
jgi:hypothetical protein